MQKIKIRFMGGLAEVTGKSYTSVKVCSNQTTCNDLVEYLHQKYSGLSEKKFAIAVNYELNNPDKILKSGDEVVLLPPFSGG
jgi:sulfur-carrier protein